LELRWTQNQQPLRPEKWALFYLEAKRSTGDGEADILIQKHTVIVWSAMHEAVAHMDQQF